LFQNYPNPFNPTTIIQYLVPFESFVNVDIYDLRGLKIKSLVNSSKSSGNHSIQWDATNESGDLVSTGMYFFTIQADKFRDTKKMLFLK